MKTFALAATLGFAVAGLALAQMPPSPFVHKTTLQTQEFPGRGEHTVTVRTVVDTGGGVSRHTHPGIEMAYVVSGVGRVKIEGRPDQDLHEGDSFAVPPRIPHEMLNTGSGPLTVVSTYVVDPAQPIASPAK
jgi:quercetin dioxygenase-like cupin family protein